MFALTLALATSARGEYVFPPPWITTPNDPQWAGGVITHQRWEFNQDLNYPVEKNNPFAPPGTPWANVAHGAGATVNGPNGTPTRVWQIVPDPFDPGAPGYLDVFVPNSPADNTRKKVVWAQVTTDSSEPSVVVTDPASGTVMGTVSVVGIANTYPTTAWYTYAYRIDIPTNPNVEMITFNGIVVGKSISEVSIDTICVPEPASVAMLASAALFLAWIYGRRRH
jgi:hypothetical protein